MRHLQNHANQVSSLTGRCSSVELKAVKTIAPEHEAQLLNYLNATGMRLGLLVNFGSYPYAEVERRIL